MNAFVNVPPPPVDYMQTVYSEEYYESRQMCYVDSEPFYVMHGDLLGSNPKIAIEKGEDQKLYICVVHEESFASFDNTCTISLLKPINFRVDKPNRVLRSQRWGCCCSSRNDLSRTLSRRFSLLSEKAFRNELSKDELGYWKNIIEDIDYRKYSVDTMSSFYVEGRVVSIKQTKITIRCFADNSLMYIVGDAIKSCSSWNRKDDIGMWVKLDVDDNIAFIERASILDIKARPRPRIEDIKVISV